MLFELICFILAPKVYWLLTFGLSTWSFAAVFVVPLDRRGSLLSYVCFKLIIFESYELFFAYVDPLAPF